MNPPAKFEQLQQRFDALSLRERMLVSLAGLVVIWLVWDSLLWQPQQAETDRLSQEEASLTRQLEAKALELNALSGRMTADPDLDTRTTLERLQTQLAALDQRIAAAADTLIPPAEMARVLETMLLRNESLRMVSLESTGSEPLLVNETEEGAPASDAPPDIPVENLYRHGFRIEFQGDYLSTLRYLQALESLPWRFYWDGIHFETEEYPQARIRLELHTLSLSEGWIGV